MLHLPQGERLGHTVIPKLRRKIENFLQNYSMAQARLMHNNRPLPLTSETDQTDVIITESLTALNYKRAGIMNE